MTRVVGKVVLTDVVGMVALTDMVGKAELTLDSIDGKTRVDKYLILIITNASLSPSLRILANTLYYIPFIAILSSAII